MSLLLAMHPLEFILRYTVLVGIVVAIIGTALCLTAKKITMVKRNKSEIDKNDKLYVTLKYIGLFLILIGMIIMVLPIETSFYKG